MVNFPTKNTSPGQLSFYTALSLAIFITIFSFAITLPWYIYPTLFIAIFISAYFIYFYTLKYFIYRKIKLIYKFIHQTKASKRETFFYENILPQKSIEEVSRDVAQWAIEKKSEIELLEENEQFRKEFLMNFSHELKTPIFTVQGYLHTLLDGAIDDPEVSKRFLTNASKGIQRLVQMAEDLDEITKLESGRISINKSHFIIRDLIKDIYAELSLKAAEKNIALEFKKGTASNFKVFADKEKIKQVMINLIDNAIKYGNPNGEVSTGFYKMDERLIYIEVSDNGIGIKEEHLPRLFERFYRVERSRNRTVGGTGLGLSIVKHIIEAHGQTINVRSKIGIGSSFGFTLENSVG